MNEWKNLPVVTPEMVAQYEIEARRLRAEVLRGMVSRGFGYLRGLFTLGHHGAAQPSK